MDTKQVIARFEAERQALAMMDHPNIAKVFDAGATETGRPYFVMELVRGTRITDYCDQNNLSTNKRLDVFIQVCHAVQHAHQKGIIHRDLKPSNILVASNDGVPVPKVIDFGIAKATQGRLTDQTLFTAIEQFIGTPAYMSPEQAELAMQDVDTRTDIYSLGVLLYELLTGKTPFDAQQLLASGLDAMRRSIREQEPERPSTKLSTMLADELTTTAKHRHTEAPKLIHMLRGDLDWIVMRCLEKDRARRYDTANGLAMDIQRHLNCEPVIARPPNRLYEFQKTVRRHKFGFAAASAVAVALMAGLAVSTWLLMKERAARQVATTAEKKAQKEASRSERVVALLKKTLQGAGPSKALGRDTTMLREILDETARSVSKDLTNEPEAAVEIYLILADTYHDLALYKEMEGVARQSLQIAREKISEENLSVALSLTSLGDSLQHLAEMHVGAFDEAEKYSRAGLIMTKKLLGNNNVKVAMALEHVANILSSEGRFAESEPMEREALGIFKRVLGNESLEVAKSKFDLALTLSSQPGKQAEGEGLAREALATQRKLLSRQHPEVAKTLRALGVALAYQGKSAEARARFEESLAIWKKLQATDRPEIVGSLMGLAYVALQEGDLGEAEAKYREALAIQKKSHGGEQAVTDTLSWLAAVLSREGRLGDAEDALREALAIRTSRFGNDAPETAGAVAELAELLRKEGKLAEVETMLRKSLEVERGRQGNESGVAWASERLARVLEEQGRFGDAEQLLQSSISLERKLLPQADSELASSLQSLSRVLRRQNRVAEAEAAQREAADHRGPQDLNWIAWRLATDPDLRYRDGASAVTFAEKAAAATNRKDPRILDTLAAAYAEAGDFTSAVRVQQEAMAVQTNSQERQFFAARLKLYQSNFPFRAHDDMAEAIGALLARAKYAEAEPLAQECLAVDENLMPDDWKTFDMRVMLGASLLGQGKYAEAESYLLSGCQGMKGRQSQMSRYALGRIVEAARLLVRLYEQTDRTEQAAAWSKTRELSQAVQEAATRRASGADNAQHGRFTEAVVDFARVLEIQPEDYHVWHWQAAALIQSGQLDAYRDHRQKGVQRFANTTDPYAADQIAKDFLVLPASGPDLETAGRLAQAAVRAPTNNPDINWFRFVKGLAEYRQGRFASAEEWMRKVLAEAGHIFGRDAEACMVLAMAQYKSNQPEEARASLSKGRAIVQIKLPKLGVDDLGDDWEDVVFAHALLDEAVGLIEGRVVTRKQ